LLSLREAAVHEREIQWSQILPAIGYGLSYTVIVLLSAIGVFRGKDIK